jgi:hypothetical protein
MVYWSTTVKVLPVVLDAQWILADKVAFEGFHRPGRCLQVAPGPGFTQARDAFVSMNLHEQIAVDEEGFNFRDLHKVPFRREEMYPNLCLWCVPWHMVKKLGPSDNGSTQYDLACTGPGPELRQVPVHSTRPSLQACVQRRQRPL